MLIGRASEKRLEIPPAISKWDLGLPQQVEPMERSIFYEEIEIFVGQHSFSDQDVIGLTGTSGFLDLGTATIFARRAETNMGLNGALVAIKKNAGLVIVTPFIATYPNGRPSVLYRFLTPPELFEYQPETMLETFQKIKVATRKAFTIAYRGIGDCEKCDAPLCMGIRLKPYCSKLCFAEYSGG